MEVRNKYFVDDRAGCVAVRDRDLCDDAEPGLWPETRGVVKFWSKGTVSTKCPTCGHQTSGWSDGVEEIDRANALAHKLNQEHLGATKG